MPATQPLPAAGTAGPMIRCSQLQQRTCGCRTRQRHQRSPGVKITIDDFAKVELRVAQIKVAERVPKADKLLGLEVDLGYGTRQILAGIADLRHRNRSIGRKVIVVANLAPRKCAAWNRTAWLARRPSSRGRRQTAALASFPGITRSEPKLK